MKLDSDRGGMVWVPGGSFTMGSDSHYPEEAPTGRIEVGGFWMDRHAVTAGQFNEFVAETGYTTVAERAPDPAMYPGADPSMLVPGSLTFAMPDGPVDMADPSSGGAGPRELLGERPGDREPPSRASSTIPPHRSRGKTRLPTPAGPVNDYRPNRSGREPPGGGSTKRSSPGVQSYRPKGRRR